MNGPQTFQLTLKNNWYTVVGPNGKNHFTKPATQRIPKIYAMWAGSNLAYVGKSIQPIATRLRQGLRPDERTGYHGYKAEDGEYLLDIWWQEGLTEKELESIEAEVAFLCRLKSGQWPEYQNEIHFHQTTKKQRKVAEMIANRLERKENGL